MKIREFTQIIAISLIIAFSLNLLGPLNNFLWLSLSVLLIILVNLFSKHLAAYYLESEIETSIWSLKRWGLTGVLTKNAHPAKEFAKPLAIGAFFPLISKIILFPISNFVWMASLTFDVKTKISKVAKKHTLYSFSEITEYQIGLIASAGLLANLVIAIFAYLIGTPQEMDFVRLSIFYVFFNMFPLSDLDGNKILFGNQIMWYTLSIITLIGMGYAFFLI